MRVKNICGKIINFGTLTLLPGQSGTLPPGFDVNPVIAAYVEQDNIAILSDAAPAPEISKADIPGDPASLKKDELIALCGKLGIEVADTDTKAALVEKIEEARAE
mgnify:CR=1 FL=1